MAETADRRLLSLPRRQIGIFFSHAHSFPYAKKVGRTKENVNRVRLLRRSAAAALRAGTHFRYTYYVRRASDRGSVKRQTKAGSSHHQLMLGLVVINHAKIYLLLD